MSFFKDKYNTVSEFFKDIRRAIDSLTTRIDDLDTRRDEAVVTQAPVDEDSPEPESVELSVSVDELGVASLQLDNDTDPVKIVGGSGVTLSVNMEGALQIDVAGGTNGSSSGGSSGGSDGGSSGGGSDAIAKCTIRNVFSAAGAYQLEANSDNIVYHPYPLVNADSSSHTHIYGFVSNQTITNNTIAAIIAITGQDASYFIGNAGFADDYGNMIFILPRNPTPLCSVRIYVSDGSTRVLVVSTEGKPIVAHFAGAQGSASGYCSDYVAPSGWGEGSSDGSDYLYVYITKDITDKWLKPYEQGYNFEWVQDFCDNQSYKACWVRIKLH